MSGRRSPFARRRAGAKIKDRLGLVLIGLALVALAAMAAAGLALRAPPTDAETLCRTDAPIAAHTYILVDGTDRLETRHRRRLRAVIDEERARLRPYDRLTIASMRADRPEEPRLIFSLCNPGDGRDANPLFQNTKRAQARWDEAFGGALEKAVRRAGGGRAGRASPIAASVRAAAADPDFSPAIAARRLVIVSDLLEHDPEGFTLYAEGAAFAGYRAAGGRSVDLSGVAVRVTRLDRPGQAARQDAAERDFWAPFLEDADARAVTFDPAP
ncbi:MAG: hypothetical protein GC206_13055 [Alphaproteobacteria bacterium]|nr:hypothetical protein [Alphaproteobacteria bacterium]